MSTIKAIIKSILPTSILKAAQKYRPEKDFPTYENLSTQQIFSKIYEDSAWGKSNDPSQKFYSGVGSHDSVVVKTYIEAIRKLLSSFDEKPDAVDIGCGDFFVGSSIRSDCAHFIACDIVESLIDFNRNKYVDMNVDFRVLDLTADDLPKGDIVFIRQVLQHLSNRQILNALPEISSKFKYLVLTEHLPSTESFIHNLDRPAGPGIRIGVNSGIVLTSPPFNLKAQE